MTYYIYELNIWTSVYKINEKNMVVLPQSGQRNKRDY